VNELDLPSLDSRINITDKMIKEHPELSNPLEIYKKVLMAQRQVRDSPKKGTNVDWDDKSTIEDLQQKAKKSGQPIASFLDPNIFDLDSVVHTIEQVIGVIIEKEEKKNWSNKFLDQIKSGKVDIFDFIGAALKGDAEYFNKYGEKLSINPALLLFFINSSIQPCFEEITKRVDPSFLERWWRTLCPICGRRPIVSRIRARKRHLICTHCGAVYLADLFLCVNCGNADAYTLKFLVPKGFPELRVDFCEKCKHYLKVVDENKLKKPIPEGLEDIMTIDLDYMAKNAGLRRV